MLRNEQIKRYFTFMCHELTFIPVIEETNRSKGYKSQNDTVNGC